MEPKPVHIGTFRSGNMYMFQDDSSEKKEKNEISTKRGTVISTFGRSSTFARV